MSANYRAAVPGKAPVRDCGVSAIDLDRAGCGEVASRLRPNTFAVTEDEPRRPAGILPVLERCDESDTPFGGKHELRIIVISYAVRLNCNSHR